MGSLYFAQISTWNLQGNELPAQPTGKHCRVCVISQVRGGVLHKRDQVRALG